MFLVLGLLAVPERIIDVAGTGLVVALILAVIARPAIVALCLAPFKYPRREMIYVGWVGLRGAVPIVLATIPVLAGAPGAQRIFDVVFFVAVVSAILPGGTVRAVTRKLGLFSDEPASPEAVLEIASTRVLRGDVMSFCIEPASAVCGSALADLPFPETASVMLLVRGAELVAPHGKTTFAAGDHVWLFCAPDDRILMQLIFGRPATSSA
jgi:potassium/hydrogen antiporter